MVKFFPELSSGQTSGSCHVVYYDHVISENSPLKPFQLVNFRRMLAFTVRKCPPNSSIFLFFHNVISPHRHSRLLKMVHSCDIGKFSFYCANGDNLSNLIGNYLVKFMNFIINSFDKFLNRTANSIAFIER